MDHRKSTRKKWFYPCWKLVRAAFRTSREKNALWKKTTKNHETIFKKTEKKLLPWWYWFYWCSRVASTLWYREFLEPSKCRKVMKIQPGFPEDITQIKKLVTQQQIIGGCVPLVPPGIYSIIAYKLFCACSISESLSISDDEWEVYFLLKFNIQI